MIKHRDSIKLGPLNGNVPKQRTFKWSRGAGGKKRCCDHIFAIHQSQL